ncbi:MAG: glycosyltransferase [Flavobacteriaceae bacterium]|nr:glycosyltransferase [Flavobacteriaceae bacterium]
MRILLVGEYSRLHNSLKEGLISLGHEVNIIGSGDGFKSFPIDFKVEAPTSKGLKKKFRSLIYKLFKKDIVSLAVKKQFYSFEEELKNYDVVQLINESSFNTTPKVEMEFIEFLKQHNKKLFLLSCGTDYISVAHAYNKKFRYSILTPLFENKVTTKDCDPALKYLSKPYFKLHKTIYEKSNGVIASDLDYHIPLEHHEDYLGLIPNPININNLAFKPLDINGRIVIFHGINSSNYYKKGSDIFEEALEVIQKKYPEETEIITVKSLPYQEYIKQYDKAHIVLDQVYSYDQGYNALEAMAKGKVVLTGAETEFIDFYGLEQPVAVNVLPEVTDVVEKLETLILNPESLIQIGKNARNFIEKEHHYKQIAKKYLEVWHNN